MENFAALAFPIPSSLATRTLEVILNLQYLIFQKPNNIGKFEDLHNGGFGNQIICTLLQPGGQRIT